MTRPVLLDAGADPYPEAGEHPTEVTAEEAARGEDLRRRLDDPRLATLAPPGGLSTAEARALGRARIMERILLDHGVPEVRVALVEGRPSADRWNDCRPVGLLSHHIASHPTPDDPTPGLWLVTHGRADLGGPLANGTAGVDLVYRILTMGLANHPGYGGPWTVDGPCGAYTIPADVGRPYLWGTEYEGGYDDATWDRVYTHSSGVRMSFREFMGRVNAGLAEAIWEINGHGKTPPPGADLSGYHGEHSTWAPDRKIDRRGYTTASGRAEIRTYQEDDVAAEDVWKYRVPKIGGADGETEEARWALARMRRDANAAKHLAKDAEQQAARNAAAIAEIGKRLDAIAPGISQAVKAALADPIRLNVDLSVNGKQVTP